MRRLARADMAQVDDWIQKAMGRPARQNELKKEKANAGWRDDAVASAALLTGGLPRWEAFFVVVCF